MVVWCSGLAIFTAALRYQVIDESWFLVVGGVMIVLFLVFALFDWSLIKIAVPFCNMLYPDTDYVDAINRL